MCWDFTELSWASTIEREGGVLRDSAGRIFFFFFFYLRDEALHEHKVPSACSIWIDVNSSCVCDVPAVAADQFVMQCLTLFSHSFPKNIYIFFL